MAASLWIDMHEAAELVGMSHSWIKKKAAERIIDPRCGRRFGGTWRFRRSVLEEEGFLLKSDDRKKSRR